MPNEETQQLQEQILEGNSDNSSIETTEVQQSEVSEIEQKARQLGWKNKEERSAEGKDNTYFVEADEYVRRQPLFDRIEKQRKEVQELKDIQKQWNQHLTGLKQEAYNSALRDLESKRRQAVEEGNVQAFNALDSQINDTKNRMSFDPVVTQQQVEAPDPTVLDWATQKSRDWYNDSTNENSRMKAAAEAVDQYLAKEAHINGIKINPKEHLMKIEAEVKRLFPHRFPSENKRAIPTVGVSTTMKETSQSTSNLISKLTPTQRELGERFQKSNPAYTLEMYAKDLEKMGRLGK